MAAPRTRASKAPPIPEYVADLLRAKDEGMMAALAFIAALRRGEADDAAVKAVSLKIRAHLSPEARALAEAHPNAFG